MAMSICQTQNLLSDVTSYNRVCKVNFNYICIYTYICRYIEMMYIFVPVKLICTCGCIHDISKLWINVCVCIYIYIYIYIYMET